MNQNEAFKQIIGKTIKEVSVHIDGLRIYFSDGSHLTIVEYGRPGADSEWCTGTQVNYNLTPDIQPITIFET